MGVGEGLREALAQGETDAVRRHPRRGDLAGAWPHAVDLVGLPEDEVEPPTEGHRVVRSDQPAGLLLDHQLRDAADAGAEDRGAASHRFADDRREAFAPRAHDEARSCVVELRFTLRVRDPAKETDAVGGELCRECPQALPVRPVADDQQVGIRVCVGARWG